MNPRDTDPLYPEDWLWDPELAAFVPRPHPLGGIILAALSAATVAFFIGLFIGAHVLAAAPSSALLSLPGGNAGPNSAPSMSGVEASPAVGLEDASPLATRPPVRVPRISGKASWYCKAGVSACHHAYPPGSMVAAACGRLRAALPDWRGRLVTVTSRTASVAVRLVDWCGSSDKLVDLYAAPFSMLAPIGAGAVPVEVSW